jgi:hypothetical protein
MAFPLVALISKAPPFYEHLFLFQRNGNLFILNSEIIAKWPGGSDEHWESILLFLTEFECKFCHKELSRHGLLAFPEKLRISSVLPGQISGVSSLVYT